MEANAKWIKKQMQNGKFDTLGGFHAQRNEGKQTQSPFEQSWQH